MKDFETHGATHSVQARMTVLVQTCGDGESGVAMFGRACVLRGRGSHEAPSASPPPPRNREEYSKVRTASHLQLVGVWNSSRCFLRAAAVLAVKVCGGGQRSQCQWLAWSARRIVLVQIGQLTLCRSQ